MFTLQIILMSSLVLISSDTALIIDLFGDTFLHCIKARSHDPILGIRFLVPKIGSRRSDGPISRFRFCGENVGRSFVVCSHGPIFRTDKESSFWCQSDHMQNLSAPFIFQEHCRMEIEHVLFPSGFFFQNYGSLCRKVIFSVFTRSDFRNQQKSDP